MQNSFVSFVHGYEDLSLRISEPTLPALARIEASKPTVFRYPFPRTPADFREFAFDFVGEMPHGDAVEFPRLPRFGLTGLAHYGGKIFAGSWNAVYQIDPASGKLERLISHRFMNDLHGIAVGDVGIVTVLTGLDMVVVSDFDGEVIQTLAINDDLTVDRNPPREDIDWRFVGKQFRGSTGIWHFNNVEIVGNSLHLTSRNASSVVIVDLDAGRASLASISHLTPVLIHDGVRLGTSIFFTSVDGKILIAQSWDKASFESGAVEAGAKTAPFNRGLISKVLRLSDSDFGREPNWCRGIAVDSRSILVTVDGRYGSDLSFGVVEIDHQGTFREEVRIGWNEIGNPSRLRYVTGFDVLLEKEIVG